MVVVTEIYFYYPSGPDSISYVVGVFDSKSAAYKLVREKYDENTELTLMQDTDEDGLWYKTRMDEDVNITFEEFELNKLR
jgi:hypothetical protein